MCGIAGIHRITGGPIRRGGKLANELLLAIESRGWDATGHLTITDDGKVTIEKGVIPASKFVKKTGGVTMTGNPRTVLLHTRFATVGAITKENAHPVMNGPMAAVHNGTIWNHAEMFAKLQRPRNATVDSEVIPAVVAHHGWEDAVKGLARLDGGMAAAIVNVKKPAEVLLARLRDYPLHVYVTDRLVVWASTRDAIERAWFRTYGAKPTKGTWVVVPEFTLLRVNGKITVEPIAKPKPRKWAAPVMKKKRPKTNGKWPFVPAGTPAKPKPKKVGGQLALPEPPPYVPAHTAIEPYMLQEVDDLMRWAKCSRAEAEEVVFGTVVTKKSPDAVLCPDCDQGEIDPDGACDVCGLTWAGLADAASWWDTHVSL